MFGDSGQGKNDLYLRELDLPHVYEVLAERFDGVMENLTKNSFVFGGAIRDIIAGLELLGDVDIAVNSNEASTLLHNFHTSPKWVGLSDLERAKRGEGLRPKPVPTLAIKSSNEKNPYVSNSSMRIKGVHTFTNSKNQKVQVIVSSTSNLGPFDDSLFPARNVDIVCCGLAMDKTGRVFEVVFDAEKQCKNRVLRHNDVPNLDLKAIEERTAKLTKRGWKPEIDFETLKKEMERAIKKAERKWKKRKTTGKRILNNISFFSGHLGPCSIEVTDLDGNIKEFRMEHDGRVAVKRIMKSRFASLSPKERDEYIEFIKEELSQRIISETSKKKYSKKFKSIKTKTFDENLYHSKPPKYSHYEKSYKKWP